MECKECGYSCDTEMVGEHHYKQLQAENKRLRDFVLWTKSSKFDSRDMSFKANDALKDQ